VRLESLQYEPQKAETHFLSALIHDVDSGFVGNMTYDSLVSSGLHYLARK
jgi:hypothetical protein